MIGVFVLIVSALCGVAFGYAAQRGSICAVAGVEQWIEQRSVRQMLAFLRCSLWVCAVAAPLVWINSDARLAPLLPPSLAALAGGILFGLGATINGGCAYGTINRLGAGEVSFFATLIGMLAGFWLAARVTIMPPSPNGSSPLETPSILSVLIVAVAMLFCAREIRLIRRRGAETSAWSPERAAALMGLSGGILHALHGSWAYVVALQEVAFLDWSRIMLLPVILLGATITGAAIAAGASHRFHLRTDAAHIPVRFAGGTVMGIGGAWVPGGNDALIMHAAPALSPHTLVAYPALIVGVAVGLRASRLVRSRTPRCSLRSILSWKISGRE